jgi:hypothetical protein
MPPWPGMIQPESFTPKARLSMDSTRSPTMPMASTTTPRMTAWCRPTLGSPSRVTKIAPPTAASMPPTAPSQVLLGLSAGAKSLWLAQERARRSRRRCRTARRRSAEHQDQSRATGALPGSRSRRAKCAEGDQHRHIDRGRRPGRSASPWRPRRCRATRHHAPRSSARPPTGRAPPALTRGSRRHAAAR